ncbi:auxin response factor 3 isoform X1 [Rhododendron vialii]|uniref:auxin response factor 3 isoform X1 n=1 Tax=Rhododendron vialii TaxID=182163 RepID=UPI00265DB229|nr:auxin response factor 3 isoform X1 [Rhododendron vialii]XP_058201209.1 auxin response factor 3 isoform X1 [Rhododendron vialii]XP_058201210.1 auxin response factor 3 isoform X1 [Rhododendron vialii]XP_058201211.1 auxin response factor 3 isoform X1 [Rhododendron vialii]
MCGLIDLNAAHDGDETASFDSTSPSSSVAAAGLAIGSSSSHVCLELWHACAGPLISLPKKGSVVVYFPQGHLERVSESPAAAYDLPPHVFCRVLDVKLHAEAATDDVYAQVSLIPDMQQIEQKWRKGEIDAESEEDDIESVAKSTTPHMFCKTLTASDTSTHGGFSVPRRAAEDCFPPLDYKQQRPSQELVAKDLHGTEWRFRHIYRGQPRRHLLTTGWSGFVNKKKLLSGDAVLFLRAGDGELRLGIRRAAQVKSDSPFTALSSQKLNVGSISVVVNAISTCRMFNVCYNPRASSSEFIIPFCKFSKSLAHSYTVGMRFKMRFEAEDAAERRYTGLITGVSDFDPVRWCGSKWRSLLVRWDDLDTIRHNRVSPWEIEPTGSVSASGSLMAPGMKRARMGLPSTKPDFLVPRDGTGVSDFGESLRFRKVLQGQEMMGLISPYDGVDVQSHHPSEIRRCTPFSDNSRISATGNSAISFETTGFGESLRFNKVLQGQETVSGSGRGLFANTVHSNMAQGITDCVRASTSWNGWSRLMQGCNTYHSPSAQPLQVSSPSSVLMFQQNRIPTTFHINLADNNEFGNQVSSSRSVKDGGNLTSSRKEYPQGVDSDGHLKERNNQLGISCSTFTTHSSYKGNQDLVMACKSSCRLFGFPLTEERNAVSNDFSPNQVSSCEERLLPKPPPVSKIVGSSCTKVSDLYAIRDTLLDIAL